MSEEPEDDGKPAHNHVTREVRQDGSCPACAETITKMKMRNDE